MPSPPAPPTELPDRLPTRSSRQLLLVTAPDWASQTAELRCYERAMAHDPWQPASMPIDVSLGRCGLAWGRGLHAQAASRQPTKQEGDGCSPAGAFAITALFGLGEFAGIAHLPFLAATSDLKAIDDPASAYYNQIIDQRQISLVDWRSCEEMLRDDARYTLGAVVAHNSEPAHPGAGSCIFLHVWGGKNKPTAGCTAMSLADMKMLASWLNAESEPVLVQLPCNEYERLAQAWGLPTLS